MTIGVDLGDTAGGMGDRSPPAGSRGVAPIGDLGSPEAEASFVKIKVKFAFR